MKNRFKFRVRIKCNNCKKEGYQYWFWNGQFFTEDCFDACECNNPAMETVGKLEQCTGYQDKNDNLIFAGDIVKMKFIVFGEDFEVEDAVIYNKKKCSYKVKDIPFSPQILHIEITGNIHDKEAEK